jgi:hypothetical protein
MDIVQHSRLNNKYKASMEVLESMTLKDYWRKHGLKQLMQGSTNPGWATKFYSGTYYFWVVSCHPFGI